MIPIVLGMLKKPVVPLVGIGIVGAGGYYLWKNFNPLAMFGKLTGGIGSGISSIYKTSTKGVFGAGKSAFKGVKSIGKSTFSVGKRGKKFAKKYNTFAVGKKVVKSPKARKAAKETRKKVKKVRKLARARVKTTSKQARAGLDRRQRSIRKAGKRLKRFKRW